MLVLRLTQTTLQPLCSTMTSQPSWRRCRRPLKILGRSCWSGLRHVAAAAWCASIPKPQPHCPPWHRRRSKMLWTGRLSEAHIMSLLFSQWSLAMCLFLDSLMEAKLEKNETWEPFLCKFYAMFSWRRGKACMTWYLILDKTAEIRVVCSVWQIKNKTNVKYLIFPFLTDI